MAKADVIYLRTIKEAEYMISTKCTIRQLARRFGVSKSTAHKDMTVRLAEFGKPKMYSEILHILKINLDDRARRGGEGLRIKMIKLRRSGNYDAKS